MTDKPVIVVATLTPLPEHRDEVREVLAKAVPPTHDEPGCELYSLHESADTFVLIEKWSSRAALEAHKNAATFTALGPALAGKLAGDLHAVFLDAVPAGTTAKGAL